MGNVTKLPDRPVREWHVIEKGLREMLAGYGADSGLTDYICAAMRPVFLKYAAADSNFVSDASMTPDEVVKALNDWVHTLTSGMMFELAVREVELYQLRGNKPIE